MELQRKRCGEKRLKPALEPPPDEWDIAGDPLSPFFQSQAFISGRAEDDQRAWFCDPPNLGQRFPEKPVVFQGCVAEHGVKAVVGEAVHRIGISLENLDLAMLRRAFDVDADLFRGMSERGHSEQARAGRHRSDLQHGPSGISPRANSVELSVNFVVHSPRRFPTVRRMMPSSVTVKSFSPLATVRNELQGLGPPVVVFNKSHSGSRLLARLIAEAGVFMGAHQNESNDSIDVLKLVEHLVLRYYPDYSPLWHAEGSVDGALPDLVREVFASHTEGFDRNGRWGWKLCETAYILPVLDFLFPSARYIHLIRDGRDVAFCDHRAPNNPFWKKIYFNTDHLLAWRGLRFHRRDYERRSHIYNAMHWANSVAMGRAFGAMLRERYLEVRYEELCESFEQTAQRVLAFAGLDNTEETIRRVRPDVYRDSVGKYRRQPKEKVREVVEVAKPLLLSLGYLQPDGLLDMAAARLRREPTFDDPVD